MKHSAFILMALVCLGLSAGCGSAVDNTPAGPQSASLEGDRRQGGTARLPAVDISKAPTKTHGELASLLPSAALEKDSLEYAGWDGPTATYDVEGAADAPLPAVAASYRSMSFKLKTGEEKSIDVEHPQSAKVILIRAPDELAADTILDQIAAQLVSKGFTERDALSATFGEANSKPVQCFSLVIHNDDVDDVYVAYLTMLGNTVLYALESEVAPKMDVGGTQISRVSESGFGTRLGAQQLMLILHNMLRS